MVATKNTELVEFCKYLAHTIRTERYVFHLFEDEQEIREELLLIQEQFQKSKCCRRNA
jgi:hypothetical protein